MPGPTPKPATQRVNKHVASRGEIQTATTAGWQHGKVPAPPDGLMPATLEAWSTWMAAWFASFWTPADVPALRQMIRLYDQVERGEWPRMTELRLMMDTLGVTPKGQQDRRWRPPVEATITPARAARKVSRYSHLEVIADAAEESA
jgi:hypothetical protein